MSTAREACGSLRRRAEYYKKHESVTPASEIPLEVNTAKRQFESNILLKHILHTKPTSTTLRWQKHAARKSTPTAVGATKLCRLVWSGRKAIIRYCSKPCGCSSFIYTPRVASDACCRKTVSPATLQMSMGMA